jgi:capsular polysaccharide biosynthesis protein
MTKLPKQALCGPTNPWSLVTMATPARNKISVKAAAVWARHTVVNHPTRRTVVYSALSVWETGHVGIS